MDNHQTGQKLQKARVLEKLNMTDIVIGIVLAVAVTFVSLYTEALAWGMEAFVVLGFDLQPTALSTTAPSWPVIFSGSMITAAGAYVLIVRERKPRRGQLTGALAASAVIFAAAHITNVRIPAETTLSLTTGWERFAYFLATSTGFATFVCILFAAWIVEFRSRQKINESPG